MDKLSMSLDDIIKQNSNSKTRGPKRNFNRSNFQNKTSPVANGGGRIRNRTFGGSAPFNNNRFNPYNRGNIETQWQHDLYESNGNYGNTNGKCVVDTDLSKLLITNLEFGVSDYDLAELFVEFGTLVSAEVHYDRSGRSLGTAEVVFKNKPSAVRAVNFYNGVPLDGRPMNIQLIEDEPRPTNSFRPNRPKAAPIKSARSFPRNQGRSGSSWNQKNRRSNNRNGTVTAEQLDAELDDYVKEN